MSMSKELNLWRGNRNAKTASDDLKIPLPTYRKYLSGKRSPNKLAEAELRRRMKENP